MDFKTLLQFAKAHEPVYLAGHVHPDGDCVGSTLGLAMLLKNAGIQSKVLLRDIPSTFSFLPIDEWVMESIPKEVGLLIVMDCGDLERIGDFEVCAHRAQMVINIDHHASNTMLGTHNFVDTAASSTSELVYRLLDSEDERLVDTAIAQSLYTGIINDTGVFKHSCTSQLTHQIAGKLIAYGFDFSALIDRMFYTKSLKALQTQARAIEHIDHYNDDLIVFTHLGQSDITDLQTNKNETEGIVQMLNEIEKVQCAVFLYELEPGTFKASMRSKGLVDVCAVAMQFSGGGHVKAAGCTVHGNVSELKKNFLEQIRKYLNS